MAFDASRRSTQKVSGYRQRGKQNIIIREKLFLTMWFMEQKVILFRCRTDIHDKPARLELARPGPVMTLSDSLFLKHVERYELGAFT